MEQHDKPRKEIFAINFCDFFSLQDEDRGRSPPALHHGPRMTIGQVINIDPIVWYFNGEEGI